MKSIKGFPGYFVDEHGDVHSNHSTGYGQPRKLHKLKAIVDNRGYRTVMLRNNGKSKKVNIGRLVLFAYIGNPTPGQIMCHGPMGQLIDSLDNLSWGTHRKNNMEDKLRDGTSMIGEKNHKAKLNHTEVSAIKRASAFGVGRNSLAQIFGVSGNVITLILSGKNWKYHKCGT